MEKCRIAVLITCHNRKQKTIDSLKALFAQDPPLNAQLLVYLVDDGSTDGTAEAISTAFPDVKILQGDGNLFWNRGMCLAFDEALKADYDFYLWLNDDTLLYKNAIAVLLNAFQELVKQTGTSPIIVGSVCDPVTGLSTYGGAIKVAWWHPFRYRRLEPDRSPKPCDTMNGNCVLVPRGVTSAIGGLDPAFSHTSGDFDYGLRARKKGCSVWLAPGYVGTCPRNSYQESCMHDPEMGLWERWQKIVQPKGLPPSEFRVMAQRHGGPLWPLYWMMPYVRLTLMSLFGGLMRPIRKSRAPLSGGEQEEANN